eukprot:TRINITY_DN2773_c0_g1_i1.p1 TRINITY_DN2773_c0_g1~~TRINITY_DN2773_c0_g1_i1.p1  ORF type:complete len:203 (-),score=31.11 TRINITY_DN2773_c0_g1_i1:77-685(-)
MTHTQPHINTKPINMSSSNLELEMNLSQIMNNIKQNDKFPQTNSDLNEQQQELQNQQENQIPLEAPSFNYLDNPLGLITGVGYKIANYFTYWNEETWTSDFKNAVKYEVTKTNWYWREQIRFLLFEDNQFKRLGSDNYGDVRAAHKYSSIRDIKTSGPYFQISYNDGSPIEYYQSLEREAIVNEILQKSRQQQHSVLVIKQD